MSSKSGLQKEVLALYRRALRMVNSKQPPARPKFRLFVRYTFHMNASSISPRDISAVEHLVRKGERQLEVYEDPSVRDCWVSEDMKRWYETWKTSERHPADYKSHDTL